MHFGFQVLDGGSRDKQGTDCMYFFLFLQALALYPSFPHDQNGKDVNGLGSLLFMQAAARHRGNPVSWKEHHKDFRSLFKLTVSAGQVEKELLIGREDLVMGCYSLAGRMLISIRSGFSPFLPKA